MADSPPEEQKLEDEYPEVIDLIEEATDDDDTLDEIRKHPIADIDSPQTLTSLPYLYDLFARSAESIVSCMYDIIDNGLSAQLTRDYLLESNSGEDAQIDVHLELEENQEVVWFRVQDAGRGINEGELISAVFGGGRSAGDGLLNHFGVGLLVALCYFESSVNQHCTSNPDWTITTKTKTDPKPRRVAGPVQEIEDSESIPHSEWDDWIGQMKVPDTGTRVEIPIPFDHLALNLDTSETIDVDEVKEEDPENTYLWPYAQRLRRRLGRDYRPLLDQRPFVQDDNPVKMYFGWDDEYYKNKIGKGGDLHPEAECRVVPLSPEFEEPADHLDHDWPEHRVMKEISWESEEGEQEAWYNLRLGYLDENKTRKEKYDIDSDDVDSRRFGETTLLSTRNTLGDIYRPSKDQQGVTITILGRAVDPHNMQVLGVNTPNNTWNYAFGYIDIVPKKGSDVPEIMKAHKQDIEEGGAAWDSLKSIFDNIPVNDLQNSNWNPDGDNHIQRQEEEDKTSLHDQRRRQTHTRFDSLSSSGVIDQFEKEKPTSGFKTDNIAQFKGGRTELVEQKDGPMRPSFAYKKIGELLELASDGYEVDIIKFRCDGITEDNESAVKRSIATLGLLHSVEVELLEPDDDEELDTEDRVIATFDPNDYDSDDLDPFTIGILSKIQNELQKKSNNVDIELG